MCRGFRRMAAGSGASQSGCQILCGGCCWWERGISTRPSDFPRTPIWVPPRKCSTWNTSYGTPPCDTSGLALVSPGLFHVEQSVDLVPRVSARLLSRGLLHVEQSSCDGQRASSGRGGLTLGLAELHDPDGGRRGHTFQAARAKRSAGSSSICSTWNTLCLAEPVRYLSTYLVPARSSHAVRPSRSGRGEGDTGYAGCERALRVGEPAGHSVPTSSARASRAQSRTLPIGLVRAETASRRTLEGGRGLAAAGNSREGRTLSAARLGPLP